MNICKGLLLIICFTSFASTCYAVTCSGDTYANGSIYQANLQHLLMTLRAHALQTDDRFYTDSFGTAPDKIYGLVMCYAFANQSDCSTCLSEYSNDTCKNSRSVSIYETSCCNNSRSVSIYETSCLIRYSDKSLTFDNGSNAIIHGPNIADADIYTFRTLLHVLMSRLSAETSSSRRLFAAGYVNSTTEPKIIYGFAQCVKNSNKSVCSACLEAYVKYLDDHYLVQLDSYAKEEGVVAGPTCFIRFEPYLFFPTELMLPESPAPAPAISASTSNSQRGKFFTILFSSLLVLTLLPPLNYL